MTSNKKNLKIPNSKTSSVFFSLIDLLNRKYNLRCAKLKFLLKYIKYIDTSDFKLKYDKKSNS